MTRDDVESSDLADVSPSAAAAADVAATRPLHLDSLTSHHLIAPTQPAAHAREIHGKIRNLSNFSGAEHIGPETSLSANSI